MVIYNNVESRIRIKELSISGNFVFQKTQHCFSAMAVDQCHEQHNATIKGDGGAVGILTVPGALHRWTVARPEISRLITEFGQHYSLVGKSLDLQLSIIKSLLIFWYHEQNNLMQQTYKETELCIAYVIASM